MHAVETTCPVTRVDAWAVDSAHCQAHYQIVAEAEPDVLCRVLNDFALHVETQEAVRSGLVGGDGGGVGDDEQIDTLD